MEETLAFSLRVLMLYTMLDITLLDWHVYKLDHTLALWWLSVLYQQSYLPLRFICL